MNMQSLQKQNRPPTRQNKMTPDSMMNCRGLFAVFIVGAATRRPKGCDLQNLSVTGAGDAARSLGML